MGVYIPNIEKPKFCKCEEYNCFAWDDEKYKCKITEWKKPCPLIEIPTPHGRLIDIEKLKEEFAMKNNICKECYSFKKCDNKTYSKSEICENFIWVPTILEAEE